MSEPTLFDFPLSTPSQKAGAASGCSPGPPQAA
jgi:hypothetical protein